MELYDAPNLKRKAESEDVPCKKKAHFAQSEAYCELDLTSDDDSASDSRGEIISDTPLTPVSSTPSPRFPSELKTHLCPHKECGKAFNRPAKLAQHVISHTNTRPFVCPHKPCVKDFLRRPHLNHHLKTAHSNVRDYVCEWVGCKKSFATATRLKRHHAAHEGRLKHQCTVAGCGQTFRKDGTLQKHIAVEHEGRKPFSCDLQDPSGNLCGQKFDTAGKLRTHEGRVHGGQRFWCAICSMDNGYNKHTMQQRPKADVAGFSTYGALQQHIKAMHPPKCSLCGLVCSTQRELKSHVEVRHGTTSLDDRKTFICQEPDCGRAFTKKGNLKVHVEATHKSKKYICGEVALESLNGVEGWDGHDACGRALSTKASLQNHIRIVHLGLGRRRVRSAQKSKNGPQADDHSASPNLMKLTGDGYDEMNTRSMLCFIPGCDFRFGRGYDLRIHLTSHHDILEDDARNLLEGLQGPMSATSDEVDLRPEFWMQDIDAEDHIDEQAAAQDGRFWIGDELYDHESRSDDEWIEDERAMRLLIGDDLSGVQGPDAMTIDPDLH
ncbi:MAG: hypothetical protein Q9192_000260 [Flavoplaca navasiana]